MITKSDFDAKLSSLNQKITKNKTKHLLVENELSRLKTFDWSYLIGKSHFEELGVQNYLIFQARIRFLKVNTITNTDCISSWKSKRLSVESIKPPTTSEKSLTPELNYYSTKTRVKFTGSSFKQFEVSYTHSNKVNIYIVSELGASGCHDSNPTLKNCLFGAVTLTKNTDIDKNRYSGYGIGFDGDHVFHFPVVDLVKMY